MSHILKNTVTRTVGKPYCAVKVEVKGNKLIIQDGISVVKADTKIAELPSKYEVVTTDGEVIKPSGIFYITVETINPYHLLIDMP